MLALALLPLSLSTPAVPFDDAPRWRDANLSFLMFDDGAPVSGDALDHALRAAARVWNDVGAGPAIEVDRMGGPPAFRYDGTNGVGFFEGPWPFDRDAGAVTMAWIDEATRTILETDIAINPAVTWSAAARGELGAYDVQNALAHELGHALGLPDLDDDPEATMYFLIHEGEVQKRDLAFVDERNVVELYEGLQLGPVSCASTPPAALFGLGALLAGRRRRPAPAAHRGDGRPVRTSARK